MDGWTNGWREGGMVDGGMDDCIYVYMAGWIDEGRAHLALSKFCS